MGSKGRAGLGQRQILRLSSHCFAFTFSNIRYFTPLRMTKWGDAFTLHSSLDSGVDLHASYLENAILVPSP